MLTKCSWGLFFFLLLFLLVIAALGWVVYTQIRARRSGLPPPSLKSYIPFLGSSRSSSATNYPTPRSSGPIEWIKDQFGKMRSGRTARGAYEETGGGLESGTGYSSGGGRRGRGLEDDAWDTQVGNEDAYGGGPGGYYEEQELGLAPTPGLHSEPYGGGSSYMTAGSGGAPTYENERGRSKSRDPAGLQPQGGRQGENPFGDNHEAASLRDVSPRPETDARGTQGHSKGQSSLDSNRGGGGDSPTSRKSMFREGL